MKENKISVVIDRPANEVFDFVVNPENTPKWIDSLVKEKVNEQPIRLGTIYRNVNKAGEWAEYEMVEFEKPKMFVMKDKNSTYHVKYILEPVGGGHTQLTYFEWVDGGELSNPFTTLILEKLKNILEADRS